MTWKECSECGDIMCNMLCTEDYCCICRALKFHEELQTCKFCEPVILDRIKFISRMLPLDKFLEVH